MTSPRWTVRWFADQVRRTRVRQLWALAIVFVFTAGFFLTTATRLDDGSGADSSTLGTYLPQGRVEYVVDEVTYEIDASNGKGSAYPTVGTSTAPQRVYYETRNPANAILGDPGGPGPARYVAFATALILLALLIWIGYQAIRVARSSPTSTASSSPFPR